MYTEYSRITNKISISQGKSIDESIITEEHELYSTFNISYLHGMKRTHGCGHVDGRCWWMELNFFFTYLDNIKYE